MTSSTENTTSNASSTQRDPLDQPTASASGLPDRLAGLLYGLLLGYCGLMLTLISCLLQFAPGLSSLAGPARRYGYRMCWRGGGYIGLGYARAREHFSA